MSYANSNRPYTPTELINKIQLEEKVNKRTAEKRISSLITYGKLKKHVVSFTIGHRAYKITLYEYLGLYCIFMALAWYMVII